MIDLNGAWKRLNHVLVYVLITSILAIIIGFAVLGGETPAPLRKFLFGLSMFGPLGLAASAAYILKFRYRRRD